MAQQGSNEGNNEIVHRPRYSTTKIGLHNKNRLQINNVRAHILQQNMGIELKEYILKKKNKWTEENLAVIDLKGMKKALTLYKS